MSVTVESQKPDPGRIVEVGTEGQDFKERLVVAKRNYVVPSE